MEPYQLKLAEQCNFTKDANDIESSSMQQVDLDNDKHHYKLDNAQWPSLGSTFKGGKNAFARTAEAPPAQEVEEDDGFVLIDRDGGGASGGGGNGDYVLISEDMTAEIVSAAGENMPLLLQSGGTGPWCDVIAMTRERMLPVFPTPPPKLTQQCKIRATQKTKSKTWKKHNNNNGVMNNYKQMDKEDNDEAHCSSMLRNNRKYGNKIKWNRNHKKHSREMAATKQQEHHKVTHSIKAVS